MARVIVINDNNEILLVLHKQKFESFWIVPGGDIEPGETSDQAGIREVEEETGIKTEIVDLIWHVEEIYNGRLRATDFFLARPSGGYLKIGYDPEFDSGNQVIKDVRYFSEHEIKNLNRVYPEVLKNEFWELLRSGDISLDKNKYKKFRKRPCRGFGIE
jgi:8-oxo-dGTP diphosphatase